MNVEDHELAEDLRFRLSDIEHRTDLYDSAQDARSEARYDKDDDLPPNGAWEDVGRPESAVEGMDV